MKTLFSFVLVAVLAVSSYQVKAQLLQKYTADAGYSAALDYAIGDLSFEEPTLLAILTGKQEIDQGGFTIKPGMDMTTGRSEAWIYIIQDEVNDDMAFVGVAKFLGQYQALDVSDLGGGQIPDFFSDPVALNWMDSDDLVDNISANKSYQNYIKSNPSSEPQNTILSVNTFNPTVNLGETYWNTTFGENEDFVCFTQAITGETTCLVLSSVKQINHVSNSISPNPASNSITLKYSNSEIVKSVKLYDSFGNVIYQSDESNINNIDLTNFASGNYTIVYEYDNKIETEKLIIKK